jgi:hypothetical protein
MAKKMTDLEIIDEIQRVRSNNNKVWMDLVRLAVTVAPKEAKAIFSRITDNDEKVSALLRKLSG